MDISASYINYIFDSINIYIFVFWHFKSAVIYISFQISSQMKNNLNWMKPGSKLSYSVIKASIWKDFRMKSYIKIIFYTIKLYTVNKYCIYNNFQQTILYYHHFVLNDAKKSIKITFFQRNNKHPKIKNPNKRVLNSVNKYTITTNNLSPFI